MYLLVDKDGQPLKICKRLYECINAIRYSLNKNNLDELGPNITIYKQKNSGLEKNSISIQDLKKMYMGGIALKHSKQNYKDFMKQNNIQAYTLEAEFLDAGYRTFSYDLLPVLALH
jgi:hypothetical protein